MTILFLFLFLYWNYCHGHQGSKIKYCQKAWKDGGDNQDHSRQLTTTHYSVRLLFDVSDANGLPRILDHSLWTAVQEDERGIEIFF